jgi:hypothetical protein
MIKAAFCIADTIHRGKKVVYVYPKQEYNESLFDSKEETKIDHLQNAQEIFINHFLKNTDFCNYFKFMKTILHFFMKSWTNFNKKPFRI